MSKSVLVIAAVAALVWSAAALAGDRCAKDFMTTQTPAPKTVVDSTGSPPLTPIPPTTPTTGG